MRSDCLFYLGICNSSGYKFGNNWTFKKLYTSIEKHTCSKRDATTVSSQYLHHKNNFLCFRSCPASLEAGLTRAVLDEARNSYLSGAGDNGTKDEGAAEDQTDFAHAEAAGMPPKNG